jgi:hypothetical protein
VVAVDLLRSVLTELEAEQEQAEQALPTLFQAHRLHTQAVVAVERTQALVVLLLSAEALEAHQELLERLEQPIAAQAVVVEVLLPTVRTVAQVLSSLDIQTLMQI